MGYSLTSKKLDLVDAAADSRSIRSGPRLARLPGVAQIRVTGGDVPEFLVAVDRARLPARGLTLQDVQDALAKANSIASVGQFDHSYQRYEVLVSGLLHNAGRYPQRHRRHQEPAFRSRSPMWPTSARRSSSRTILATGDGKPARHPQCRQAAGRQHASRSPTRCMQRWPICKTRCRRA